MKKNRDKIVTMILISTLATSIFVGCSKAPKETSTSSNEAVSATYPIKTDVTLKYWCGINGNIQPIAKTYDELEFTKEYTKKTGVKLQYLHPAAGSETEAFNLLLVSNDLPDLIEYNWSAVPGGPEKAISDGSIIKLNELINKYSPNLKKYLDSNPDVNKAIKTDNENYYVYPFLRGDKALQVFLGPVIRKDLIDGLNLKVPTTIDEWYTTLKALKDQKGAEAPFTGSPADLRQPAIVGAYGIIADWYMEDGKVKFGRIDSRYKDYLNTMNKWYKEGIIDKNFATIDTKTRESQILSGKSVSTITYSGSGLGKLIPAGQEKDAKYDLVAMPSAVVNKGDKPKFGQLDRIYDGGYSTAITTGCKNPEIAARFLDYGYSEEGNMLMNYGIAGVSYNMVNNYPTYTDLIIKNPNKLPIGQALSIYNKAAFGGPMVKQKPYIEQYLQLPQQKDAVKVWAMTEQEKYALPAITPLATESAEYAGIMSEINTYADEMFMKFVMGVEPISKFDDYVNQIKKLKVDRAISIQQAALERYNKR